MTMFIVNRMDYRLKHLQRLTNAFEELFPDNLNETFYDNNFEKNVFKTAAAEYYLNDK